MTRWINFLLVLLFAIGSCRGGEENQTPQWIVVMPPAFRKAMTPLIEHRQKEKLRVKVIETTDFLSPEQIRRGDSRPLQAELERLSRPENGPTYILLAGSLQPADAAASVPPLRGEFGRMKGRPSDYGFGCQGGHSMPSAAVGRFPARNVVEVEQMGAKDPAAGRKPIARPLAKPAFCCGGQSRRAHLARKKFHRSVRSERRLGSADAARSGLERPGSYSRFFVAVLPA